MEKAKPRTKITKRKHTPSILKKQGNKQTKITFDVVSAAEITSSDDEEAGPSKTQTKESHLTVDEVYINHVPLMLEAIQDSVDSRRALYAQLVLPALIGDETAVTKKDIFYLINFYHGYNPAHLFGAQLAVLEFVYSGIHNGRIHRQHLEECLENILFYFLSVRTAIFSGRLLPSPGSSLIRVIKSSTQKQFNCCLQLYVKKRKDKSSALLEHILHHYSHEPSKRELVKFKHPWKV